MIGIHATPVFPNDALLQWNSTGMMSMRPPKPGANATMLQNGILGLAERQKSEITCLSTESIDCRITSAYFAYRILNVTIWCADISSFVPCPRHFSLIRDRLFLREAQAGYRVVNSNVQHLHNNISLLHQPLRRQFSSTYNLHKQCDQLWHHGLFCLDRCDISEESCANRTWKVSERSVSNIRLSEAGKKLLRN
jgi:hypothetical protein